MSPHWMTFHCRTPAVSPGSYHGCHCCWQLVDLVKSSPKSCRREHVQQQKEDPHSQFVGGSCGESKYCKEEHAEKLTPLMEAKAMYHLNV